MPRHSPVSILLSAFLIVSAQANRAAGQAEKEKGDIDTFTIKSPLGWEDIGLEQIKRVDGGNVELKFKGKEDPIMLRRDGGRRTTNHACEICPIRGVIPDFAFELDFMRASLPDGALDPNKSVPFRVLDTPMGVWGYPVVMIARGDAYEDKAGSFSQVILDTSVAVKEGEDTLTAVPSLALPQFDGFDPYVSQHYLHNDGGRRVATVLLDIPLLFSEKTSPPKYPFVRRALDLTAATTITFASRYHTYFRTDCNCDQMDETFIFKVSWGMDITLSKMGAIRMESEGTVKPVPTEITGTGIAGDEFDTTSYLVAAANALGPGRGFFENPRERTSNWKLKE